jgi:hypothetical protein
MSVWDSVTAYMYKWQYQVCTVGKRTVRMYACWSDGFSRRTTPNFVRLLCPKGPEGWQDVVGWD